MSDNMAIEFASLTKSALESMERKLVKLSVVEMEPSNPNLAQYADDLETGFFVPKPLFCFFLPPPMGPRPLPRSPELL